ncbi:MAG TPA: GH3 auxin-responsive promoter family protein [Gemmatimonadales bacterium]|jgi:hypothetical protein
MKPATLIALRLAACAMRGRFVRSAREPATAQERVRRRILAAMARTAYGRACGMHARMSYRAFADRVPVVDYEDLEPWIARQVESREPILAPEPILVYEETSGSSGRRKRIPYTSRLLRSFNRAFVLWAADLVLDGPRFRTGRAFFSISPAFREAATTPSGVPIGLADDMQYLAPAVRRAVSGRLVVPPAQSLCLGMEEYRLVLACRLLAAADLEVVSVWSPTYLLALMNFVELHRDEVATAVAAGRISVSGFTFPMQRRPAVRALLRESLVDWTGVWPELRLLSCWTDGASGPFAARLATRFPGRMLQGKGLLATEAAITVPLVHAKAPVPLVGDVFLEFERVDGTIARLQDLELAEEASLVVSQCGGLVRYRMHDRVRVDGRYGATPCLRFLGRDGVVSDLVGEKLHEVFVHGAMRRALGDDAVAVLAPRKSRAGPGYACLVDRSRFEPEIDAARLERELSQGFQYHEARLHGQLCAVHIILVPDLLRRMERLWLARGLKWGDIKQTALLARVTAAEMVALTGDAADAGMQAAESW